MLSIQSSLFIPRKTIEDKGMTKGSKILSEQDRFNIIESNRKRKKIC